MGAIVATLVYCPIGAALAILFGISGISFADFLTFGGALGTFSALVAWWVIFFAAACVYALCAFPWHADFPAWTDRK